MSSVEDRILKLREERLAREKARIEKLRELNLKKYQKNEPQPQNSVQHKTSNNIKNSKSSIPTATNVKNVPKMKNNFHVNGTTKRPISVPLPTKKPTVKDTTSNLKPKSLPVLKKDVAPKISNDKPFNPIKKPSSIPTITDKKPIDIKNKEAKSVKLNVNARDSRKTLAPKPENMLLKTTLLSRKSVQPQKTDSNANPKESVFDRLYKPKAVAKKVTDDVKKLQTDPNYLKKVIKDSGLILNKRHTVFDVKPKVDPPVRRSISAVHFKRISKSEMGNCIHKWSSIGEKLDKIHLNEINEDDAVKEDKVISAVKSERKKVKFQTPVPFNFNTPRPEELQARLKSWLQKRGKSLDSYHHLQCFGIHHINQKIKPIIEPPRFELYDDEDKENIAVENDSDNDSFTENMNDLDTKWRRASNISEYPDSVDLNDTQESMVTSSDTMFHVDEVLVGALNDLTDLLREGFDWEQCARWLRALRERFPYAADTASYWECRAALEERRGDLPASVECWEEAIAKGTERSVVEANLDQLLDKFMQLKISPTSGKTKRADPKMVDVKNVFKSTIIRFAVQQAKLRNSNSNSTEPVKYTVTPVRRSGRLSVPGSRGSVCWSGKRAPLQVCSSVRRAEVPGPLVFVPNDKLCESP
ncbi:uncharacterized protein LOC135085765 [Ostrinia nubilalis]|uniref:uncharacterized protein LOC135085765 n=1 Tax=Ostrinia nubilalis TaxID=29057 RepID=UPI0030822F18